MIEKYLFKKGWVKTNFGWICKAKEGCNLFFHKRIAARIQLNKDKNFIRKIYKSCKKYDFLYMILITILFINLIYFFAHVLF
jgi:hypothetical protein